MHKKPNILTILLTLALALGAVGLLAGCELRFYQPMQYTISFVADGRTVASYPFTLADAGVEEPRVPARAGYDGAWQAYALSAGDMTVEAVYTPITHTVEYWAGGEMVAAYPFTVEGSAYDPPSVPDYLGFVGSWEEFDFSVQYDDFIVRALYTSANATDGLVYVQQESADGPYYRVTGYEGSDGAIVVPSYYHSLPVREISARAFRNCINLTKITLPETLTYIGNNAFTGCYKLVEVWNNSTAIKLSAGSTEHGGVARYALSLSQSEAPISNMFEDKDGYLFIESGALFYLVGYNGEKIDLTLPEVATMPSGSTRGYSIYNYAFSGRTDITSVFVPKNVNVGAYAFSDCTALTTVTVECSSIDERAFSGCTALEKLEVSTTLVSAGDNCFASCNALTDASIPMLLLADNVALSCGQIRRLTLRNGALGRGTVEKSFAGGKLEQVVLDGLITTIGANVFSNNTNLMSVTVSDKLTAIGANAFAGCTRLVHVRNLSSLDIQAGSSDHGGIALYARTVTTTDGLFRFADGYGLVTVDGGNECLVGYVGEDATALVLPAPATDKTYEIDARAFYRQRTIRSVTIPQGVTKVGDEAFYGCASLASVTLPQGVTTVGDRAFSGCTSLASVTIPQGATTVGERAFYGCTALVSVTILEGVTTVGDGAFHGCRSLRTVRLADSVTSLGKNVFTGCTVLEYETVDGRLKYIGNWLMGRDTSAAITVAKLKSTTVGILDGVFSGCVALMTVELPATLRTIGMDAFSGCVRLVEVYNLSTLVVVAGGTTNGRVAEHALVVHSATSASSIITNTADGYRYCKQGDAVGLLDYTGTAQHLTLPDILGDSTTYTIYPYAFSGKNIVSVTMPNSVTEIGAYAFQSCTSLAMINIPSSVRALGSSPFAGCYYLRRVLIEQGDNNSWANVLAALGAAVVTWNAAPHNYTFDTRGGEDIAPIYAIFLAELPVPVRQGVQFAGWYSRATGSAVSAASCYYSDSDVELYARWSGDDDGTSFDFPLSTREDRINEYTLKANVPFYIRIYAQPLRYYSLISTATSAEDMANVTIAVYGPDQSPIDIWEQDGHPYFEPNRTGWHFIVLTSTEDCTIEAAIQSFYGY